jgi:DNA-binding GntR family transcriptional regulator
VRTAKVRWRSPPRVDYELTELGDSLKGPVAALGSWAFAHLTAIRQAQWDFDQRLGDSNEARFRIKSIFLSTIDELAYRGVMNVRESDASLTQQTYHQLRDDVLSGRARPGSRLKISEIGEQLSANMSAVREALSRLCADGLVVALPQRGFRVVSVSVSELRDLTRTRIEITSLCMRKAVANPDIGWETGLVAAGHQLLRTPNGSAEWKPAHSAFHRALVAGCGSPWLLRLHDQLDVQADRYRALSLLAPGSRRNIDAEHKGLMEAMLARDADLACDRIAAHFELTTNAIIEAGIADAE